VSKKKGSAAGSATPGGAGKQPAPTGTERAIASGIAALGQLAERFGVSFAVFASIVLTVWLLGVPKTHDDFIREALFGQITGLPILGIFLALLLLNTVFPITTWLRSKRGESEEIKRLTAERDRLQEKLIGRELHHTDGKGRPGARVEQPPQVDGVGTGVRIAAAVEIEEPRQESSAGSSLRSNDPGPTTGGGT
jgi:hypothetical protein